MRVVLLLVLSGCSLYFDSGDSHNPPDGSVPCQVTADLYDNRNPAWLSEAP